MSLEEIREKLIDLYLCIKIRKSEDIKNLTNNKINKERKNLKKLSTIEIINYIQNSIDVLVDIKTMEKLQEQLEIEELKKFFKNNEDPNDSNGLKLYEGMLIKAEEKIRNHIRVRKYYFIILNILKYINLFNYSMNKN